MLAPAIGAVLVLLIPREKGEAIKMVAAATTGVSLLLSFYVFLSYDRVLGGFQFEERSEWIKALGITYHVGVDGFVSDDRELAILERQVHEHAIPMTRLVHAEVMEQRGEA